MTEADIQAAIMRDLGRGETRIFRNSVGQGWTGEAKHIAGGAVLISNARPVRFGLMDGSHDLIGWRSVVITPEMVGQRFARFLSVEVKSATGRPRPGQVVWAENLRQAGALVGIARSVEQARLIAGLPVEVLA
jgi:hypothetical protein